MTESKERTSAHTVQIPNPKSPEKFNLYKELKKSAVDLDLTLQEYILKCIIVGHKSISSKKAIAI